MTQTSEKRKADEHEESTSKRDPSHEAWAQRVVMLLMSNVRNVLATRQYAAFPYRSVRDTSAAETDQVTKAANARCERCADPVYCPSCAEETTDA